ncbi:MAG: MBL fold metallo-hydrolase [Chloroflexi bacterium]|nr:MAG: MBL fold metallo-hydrolase [Chloroflexota bacterium]
MKEIVPGLWDVDEVKSFVSVHVYLWRWAEGVTVIDTGTPGNAEIILAGVRKLGLHPSDVKRIIITHGDVDHTGSLKALKRATGAQVICHTVEMELLEHPGRRKPARTPLGLLLRPIFAVMMLFPQFRVEPLTPDRTHVDSDKLPEGFTIVHTPGHTPGHISLLHPEKRFLIAGDAIHNRGGKLGAPPPLFTPDVENSHRSIWKLAKKYGDGIDTIVCGHGDPIPSGGQARLNGLVETLFEAEAKA